MDIFLLFFCRHSVKLLGGYDGNSKFAYPEDITVPSTPVPIGADGLCFDPARALRHLRKADTGLAAAIKALGPFTMKVNGADSTFSALAEAIVYQQLHAKAAATIYARFCLLFGRSSAPLPEEVLALPVDAARSAGLSRAKAMAIWDLAARVVSGNVPTLEEALSVDDEQLVQRLSEVRGIGRWTAEMFLIFRLGRPDVLPVGDFGLRRGFGIVFALGRVPTPAEVEERARPWRPYRTVASWYLWRAADNRGPLVELVP